jgi:hypothetical protein
MAWTPIARKLIVIDFVAFSPQTVEMETKHIPISCIILGSAPYLSYWAHFHDFYIKRAASCESKTPFVALYEKILFE